MLGSLGLPELLVIFLIVIVIFGAGKLPQLGKGLGDGINRDAAWARRARTLPRRRRTPPQVAPKPASPVPVTSDFTFPIRGDPEPDSAARRSRRGSPTGPGQPDFRSDTLCRRVLR
jgi:sec-independent protein translocase protein TatA